LPFTRSATSRLVPFQALSLISLAGTTPVFEIGGATHEAISVPSTTNDATTT
jgi:hypothetical protein